MENQNVSESTDEANQGHAAAHKLNDRLQDKDFTSLVTRFELHENKLSGRWNPVLRASSRLRLALRVTCKLSPELC